MNIIVVIELLFWFLLGVLYIWGPRFQYHELIIGVCALLIFFHKLIAALRSNP